MINISYSCSSHTTLPSPKMDRPATLFFTLFLLYLLSSTVVSTVTPEEINDDDLLIRQVVSEGDDLLLNAEHHFTSFKQKFGKTYATPEEHDYRFDVFKANLRRAKRHQKLDPSAVHGITKFSDLTPREFRRKFLGLKPLRLPNDAQKAPLLPTKDLPKDFDWRDHGAVTEVKNQVRCFLLFFYFLLLSEDSLIFDEYLMFSFVD